jgi:uncharacterized protein YrrD
MDISINAKVNCQNQECGKINSVIINPISKIITHIVVQEKGLIGINRLVPIEKIIDSNPNQITLSCEEDEFFKFEAFNQDHYLYYQAPYLNFEPGEYYLYPYMVPKFEDSSLDETSIDEMDLLPPGELEIHRGSTVQATDGKIGVVDEFLISPVDNHITHIVLKEGHFWGKSLVTIPVSEIDKIETNIVYLKLDTAAIETLPVIPVKRLFP